MRKFMVESSKPLALFSNLNEAKRYYVERYKAEKPGIEVSLLKMRFKIIDGVKYSVHEILFRSVKKRGYKKKDKS